MASAHRTRALGLAGLCGGLLALAGDAAWAGPPFVTDDPEPVEYQHFETYLASEQTGTIGGHTTTNLLEVNYGALPDVQVSVSLPFYVINTPAGMGSQAGPGDVMAGVKYRFVQETDSQPMVAVYPSIIAATGNAGKGLGNGGSQIFLPVWLQKSDGDWHTFGGGGYWINRAPGGSSHWYFGLAVMNDVTGHLSLGGEAYHATDQKPLDNASNGFNLGGIYTLDKHNRILFSAGRAVVELSSQNSYSTYVAYSLSW
jgi:hypothetical protein